MGNTLRLRFYPGTERSVTYEQGWSKQGDRETGTQGHTPNNKYEYDLINRMTKKIIPGDPLKVTDYTYDELGRGRVRRRVRVTPQIISIDGKEKSLIYWGHG